MANVPDVQQRDIPALRRRAFDFLGLFMGKGGYAVPGSQKYTGYDIPLGGGSEVLDTNLCRMIARARDTNDAVLMRIAKSSPVLYCTPPSATEFAALLGMKQHPALDELIAKDVIDESLFDSLVSAQPLAGVKVLDLGCGLIPAFARCARAIGADVYTADINSADDFIHLDRDYSLKGLEKKNHIQIDLAGRWVKNTIEKELGTNFDFIGHASLMSTDCMNHYDPDFNVLDRDVAHLLKEDGILFSERLDAIYRKNDLL